MDVRIFRNRAFGVENIILGVASMAFIPVFFFASTYGQISLGEKATDASLLILYFFLGFVIAAQIGGRMLDRAGARRPVVLGCVLAAVGFFVWAGKVTGLHVGLPSDLDHRVRRGHGTHARTGQHRCDQPRLPALLRRGHRHHPDRPQLRREPRVRHPRHGPDLRFPVQHHQLAHRPGRARPSGVSRGGRAPPNCKGATATSPPSRSSSGPTSPPRPRTCSTAWASSWRWPPSSPSSASGAASSRPPAAAATADPADPADTAASVPGLAD